MNFLKRTLLSIWGHKGRTIILFVAFAVIGSMLLSSLLLSAVSRNARQTAEQNIGCQIMIAHKSYRYKTSDGVMSCIAAYVQKDFESNVAKIPHITFLNHIKNYNQSAENFKIKPDEVYESTIPEVTGEVERYTYAISLQSVTDSSKLTQFLTDNYKLVSGRHLNKSDTGKNNVLINQKTAKDNGLKVSDQIKTTNYNSLNQKCACTYTIVGIFSAPICDFDEARLSSFNDPGKLIFTSNNPNLTMGETNTSIQEGIKKNDDLNDKLLKRLSTVPDHDLTRDEQDFKAYLTNFYKVEKREPAICSLSVEDEIRAENLYAFVDNPQNLQTVIHSLKNMPNANLYYFQTNKNLYNRITKSVAVAEKLSSMFAYIVLGAGILIMALIVLLSYRGRKHEFGILLSMGEKRAKIVIQVLLETLIPVLFSFIVAFSVSGIVAQKTGNVILQKNYTSAKPTGIMDQMTHEMSNTTFNVNNVEQINSIDIQITSLDIFAFTGCSLLVVFLATGIPMIKIVKLSPMKVLMKKE